MKKTSKRKYPIKQFLAEQIHLDPTKYPSITNGYWLPPSINSPPYIIPGQCGIYMNGQMGQSLVFISMCFSPMLKGRLHRYLNEFIFPLICFMWIFLSCVCVHSRLKDMNSEGSQNRVRVYFRLRQRYNRVYFCLLQNDKFIRHFSHSSQSLKFYPSWISITYFVCVTPLILLHTSILLLLVEIQWEITENITRLHSKVIKQFTSIYIENLKFLLVNKLYN